MANLDNLSLPALRSRQGEKWKQYPDDVIPAWVADMDFEIAAPIREAIISRVNNFDCGYPVSPRDTGLPDIFAARVKRKYNWQINASQVDLFNDVVQGIYFGLLALSEPHDGVVIQTPIYPPFLSSVAATKRRAIECPLRAGESQFEIDFDQFESAIDKQTRILLFCNPHNPSGRCFRRAELEKIADIVLRHNLFVISDEIHADLVLDDTPHIPIASLSPEVAERTVTLMSASKAFNMAGVCMAFAVFGGSEIKQHFNTVPRHLRGGMSALSVAGVTAALTEGDSWLAEVLEKLRANRDKIQTHVESSWPQIGYLATQATYLAWLDCNRIGLTCSPYEFFLDKAKVALSDGARFGQPGKGFVRLNFATSSTILDEIISRMSRALSIYCS